MKVREVQASYVSGAVDRQILGRVDTEVYTKAALRIENCYISAQGSVKRREGQKYLDTTTTSQEARLIPFEFNAEQTYILVFTPGEFKVYRTDVDGTVQTTVSSAPISSLTADMIAQMRYTQSADTLYLVHKDIQPIKITRTGHTAWTATSVTFSNIPVFAFSGVTTSTPAGSITPDAKTGIITVTGSGTNFTSSYEKQYLNLPKFGKIFVTTVNTTTELEGVVVQELQNTSAVSSGDWELEEGYEDVISGTRGWVRSITFYKGRLWLGGLGSRPQTILGSVVGEFENLREGESLDDEAINITIDDDRVNQIADLFPGRGLQIFTTGGEFTLRVGLDEAITPTNAFKLLEKETLHGSGPEEETSRWPRPVSVDGATLFSERKGSVLRQFLFNDVEQSFNATNISILAQNKISSPVAMDIRRSVADTPTDYVYIVNDDGTLAVLNSLREQNLLAYTTFTTDGEYEDVAVSGRIVYLIVKRTVNGSTVRFLEKLDSAHFMDASVRTDNGSPTTSWTGLSHLNTETVKVRGDDYIYEDETVSSGSITSSESATILEAGLNFSALIEHLPVHVVIRGQSFIGQYQSPVFLNILLEESRNIIVQYGGKNYSPSFRNFGDEVLDQPVTNFSGYKKVYLARTDRQVQPIITQDQPLEFNVLATVIGMRV